MRVPPRPLTLVLLALTACGAGAPMPSNSPSAATAALQPCDLAEGRWTLRVPVPPDHALAAAEDACLLIDERHEATFASLATLSADAEGADLLASDPDDFFRTCGLLGSDPRPVGRDTWTLLGERVDATRWAATLEALGPREVHTAALRRGPHWLLVLVVSAPGDREAQRHLRQLLAEVRPP